MGAEMGKGGCGRGKKGSKGPVRPWERQVVRTIVKTVYVPVSKGKGKGKGKSKGKGKGKGKSKGKRSAPLSSEFWERKLEDENREVLGDETYTGTIQRYVVRHGYGFVLPDNPKALPKQVRAKLQQAVKETKSKGKEVEDPDLIYFRKPDVNHEEDFKLTDGASCTFQVYIDDKGAGACDI